MTNALSAPIQSLLRSKIDTACSNTQTDIPGVVFVAVDKNGERFSHASGKRGVGSDEPMTLDSIFSILSCTKLVTAIACMQLVEKGVLSLDDPDQVEKLSWELKDIKVLQDGKLVEKKNRITLRMLLSHTAGFGYTFFHEELRDFSYPVGYDEFSGHLTGVMQPLVHHPGEAWEYGVGIDWAGILLERVTGLKLGEYMQKNIFEPLGIDNISFSPSNHTAKLAYMNSRSPDGKLSARDHLLNRSLNVGSEDDAQRLFHSGGAGLFAQPQQYAKILSTLLNNGVSPHSNRQILRKETVDEMFRNQIPKFPNFGRKGVPAAKPLLTNPIPELYPNGEKPQGWGLSFMITGGATGRSESTGYWAGLANLFWWMDREKGIGGIICTQILPFADLKVVKLWAELEGTLYAAMSEGSL
ncbi:beta-lactamase family protein [Talaromyces proteolyticus]|uniref:Beta-lactamase family protein n=1 Tax=Talaromyces proteolyticus TaxID=1131652 RepID=A0AAD4KTN5_9EURO|nr:beta-lactamase family protein [Talaromyces proteolyticus]KAH8699068.1 beta-lactamase family protein [Talaromyces proteolyticus]